MGVMDHAESSVTDSAFYQIHYYVDNLYKKHKYYSPQIRNEVWKHMYSLLKLSNQILPWTFEIWNFPHSIYTEFKIRNLLFQQNMAYPGITVRQVGLNSSQHVTQLKTEKFPVLTTYFEYYSYNVTNAVIDCQKLEVGLNLSANFSAILKFLHIFVCFVDFFSLGRNTWFRERGWIITNLNTILTYFPLMEEMRMQSFVFLWGRISLRMESRTRLMTSTGIWSKWISFLWWSSQER